ncbi:hypothetical protein [Paenibacillus sp. KN14-4R]|uniref:hypothetical protein n=1 Tax=Paenibacillus sp. KN14-4R TaxID=3445773 RepID=UPI003F9FBC0E
MIPFSQTWPYETIGKDVYVMNCPYCEASNVLLPLKVAELPAIHDGKKRLLVFPCCNHSLSIIDVDADYLLTDKRLRG